MPPPKRLPKQISHYSYSLSPVNTKPVARGSSCRRVAVILLCSLAAVTTSRHPLFVPPSARAPVTICSLSPCHKRLSHESALPKLLCAQHGHSRRQSLPVWPQALCPHFRLEGKGHSRTEQKPIRASASFLLGCLLTSVDEWPPQAG